MSLIRVRRNRKKNWIDSKRPYSPGKLLAFLFVVGLALYFLTIRF
ncbi:MAG: hypothetical protein WEA09_07075 [Gemmatimonadota bacterium]